ncbi:MAG TPA: radical SAM protein [Terriglobia bacterium]|jgi:DNA repair photolyase|nr:radical SAM protein [Terriglobia bacterium]
MATTPFDPAAGCPPARLVGIARLAADSPKTRERASVEYFALASKSALNRESSGRMPFDWTLNPYRGCEFGCQYCYARYTHEFMELRDTFDFERKIFAKVNGPELLRGELAKARDRGQSIALGTATDPYQPAEKQFEITRRILEVFAGFEGLDFSITTKSVLILRDLDLLKTIASRHRFSVHLTVTTTDERLARLLEPKAPPPERRLEAVKRLVEAGIDVCINAMPILPGINDDPAALDDLSRQSAAAGARTLHANVLFLMPTAMSHFMPFLEAEFPHMVGRYRRLYARSAYLSGDYKERIGKLVAELRAKYGLDARRSGPTPNAAPQMLLPWGEARPQ